MRPDGWVAAVAGVVLGTAVAGAGVWWWGLRDVPATTRRDQPPRVDAGAPVPHVGVTLFAPSPEGDALTPVRREIPRGLNPADQGRLVAEAAVEHAASPDVGLLPIGVTLRTFFLTAQGDAIIDVGGLPATVLASGTTAERLAMHALVSAVTVNIPGARSVRILVNGEVPDGVAGHLDLRGPLAADRESLRRP